MLTKYNLLYKQSYTLNTGSKQWPSEYLQHRTAKILNLKKFTSDCLEIQLCFWCNSGAIISLYYLWSILYSVVKLPPEIISMSRYTRNLFWDLFWSFAKALAVKAFSHKILKHWEIKNELNLSNRYDMRSFSDENKV